MLPDDNWDATNLSEFCNYKHKMCVELDFLLSPGGMKTGPTGRGCTIWNRTSKNTHLLGEEENLLKETWRREQKERKDTTHYGLMGMTLEIVQGLHEPQSCPLSVRGQRILPLCSKHTSKASISFRLFVSICLFVWLHPWHVEVHGPEVKPEP